MLSYCYSCENLSDTYTHVISLIDKGIHIIWYIIFLCIYDTWYPRKKDTPWQTSQICIRRLTFAEYLNDIMPFYILPNSQVLTSWCIKNVLFSFSLFPIQIMTVELFIIVIDPSMVPQFRKKKFSSQLNPL